MLMKSVSIAALVIVSATLLWAQGGGQQQQGFINCDVDIRPRSRPEVQVYWTPTATGVDYQVWSTRDTAVRLGFPDGTQEIYLTKGIANTVTFSYDPVSRVTTMATCNNGTLSNCPTRAATPITVNGSYNPLLAPIQPTEQPADPGPDNTERILVTGGRFGLEFPFTLAIPKP